jgi:hypothetical protein
VTEKLCPVDKQTCVRERCAIWIEDRRCCAWAVVPGAAVTAAVGKEAKSGKKKPEPAAPSSKYRVHLFD